MRTRHNSSPARTRSRGPDRDVLHPEYDTHLPIFERKTEIVNALQSNQVLIIAGETGSGKSTQVPQMCLEAGLGAHGKIGCTQPRRIAATSLARYVAQRLGCALGSQVGYKIRFQEQDTQAGVIKFMTDGILLNEIQSDPLLERYDAIVIDEAHERSLNIDFLLGYMRRILLRRPSLRLIISSATIDTNLFSQAFGNAPILEVSGRLFPVEELYDPIEDDGVTYVEAAVEATRQAVELADSGDILVFMPTERDIRETLDALGGRPLPGDPLLLPLFGRLSVRDQHRIFQPHGRRKIVVATNIAETSLTVPGIRFVIDTGLARMIRYVPQLRTSRMPIEPISKAAADQRKGRCGRVRDGICIRLYSQDDYHSRDEYTTPEIRRTNLAGVVLQMADMGLGDMEDFPFLQPPRRRAIGDAYSLLTQLGAMNPDRRLTGLGRKMARLPLDPHISRMVLQASREHALREVRVIAAGLSIADPRERPAEKRDEADQAQKRFVDPMSDFLTYLKLWDTYHGEWERLRTQNAMRRFCRDHFLSYQRMREWHDVHKQLSDLCRWLKGLRENTKPASYEAIHRSLLSGLLVNVAMATEKGAYRATRGREVRIFPGSSLFGSRKPWIMCHEIVETSRVYARTVGAIDPQWIERLAPALCRSTYAEPRFDEETGTVYAREQVSFFGLPIVKGRRVFYGRINRNEAHEVFVEQGLVEGRLRSRRRFLAHNRGVRDRIERMEAKLRTRSLYAGDDAAKAFYHQRIPGVCSIQELDRAIRKHGGDSFLFMQESDLLASPVPAEAQHFPNALQLGDSSFPLTYRYEPGAEEDGATVSVDRLVFSRTHEHMFEWALPALWPDKVRAMLNTLPPAIKRRLPPAASATPRIVSHLVCTNEPFATVVCRTIAEIYNVHISPADLQRRPLPPHADLRVNVHDSTGETVASFRATEGAPGNLRMTEPDGESGIAEFSRWERTGLTEWDFDLLPERIEAPARGQGVPLYGYPALRDTDGRVDMVVCRSAREARDVHRHGVRCLLEHALASELGWAEKELRPKGEARIRCAPFGSAEQTATVLMDSIRRSYLELETPPRTKPDYEKTRARLKSELRGIGFQTAELFAGVLQAHGNCIALIEKLARKHTVGALASLKGELHDDLTKYIREIYSPGVNLERLRQYPRYLRAFLRRIENAYDDNAKYRLRMKTVHTYESVCDELASARSAEDETASRELEELVQMVEELKISLFAQQAVKTRYPISEKRLNKKIDAIRNGSRS